MTSIRVDYSRKVGLPGEYSSRSVSGSVEVDIPKGQDWQQHFTDTFGELRSIIDGQFSALPREEGERSEASAPSTPPADVTPATGAQEDATAEVSHPLPIVPHAPVAYDGCRVMFPAEALKGKKEGARIRIGNPEIPGQYVNAKAFSDKAEVLAIINLLRPGDFINIKGKFDEPFGTRKDGSPSYDLIADFIERV